MCKIFAKFGPLVPVLALLASPYIVQAQNTCDLAARPCIDKPHEGDIKVIGKVFLNAAGQVAAGTAISVKVNGTIVGPAQVDMSKGTFSVDTNSLSQYDTVQADQTIAGVAGGTTNGVAVLASATTTQANGTSSVYTLGLAGINATGSSTSGPQQQYFIDFDVVSPLGYLPKRVCPKDDSHPLSQKCWIWLNPRIASVPAASSTSLSSLTSSSSLTTGIGSQTIGQITQSFEFQAGIVYYLTSPRNGRQYGWNNSWARTSAALLLGAGSVTPFSPITGASEFTLNGNLGQQFNQNTALPSLYPQLAAALCNYQFTGKFPGANGAPTSCPATPPTTVPASVAFVFPNRSRFYRDFYGGIRISTFYFTGDCKKAPSDPSVTPNSTCKLTNSYPGTFDIRFGEDETVTGGKLRGVVMTVTGSYPVPGTNGALRVFGSSYLRLHKNQNTTALVLIPSTSFVSLDQSSVVVQPIVPSDQDYFRLGIGVDLIALISSKWGTGK